MMTRGQQIAYLAKPSMQEYAERRTTDRGLMCCYDVVGKTPSRAAASHRHRATVNQLIRTVAQSVSDVAFI